MPCGEQFVPDNWQWWWPVKIADLNINQSSANATSVILAVYGKMRMWGVPHISGPPSSVLIINKTLTTVVGLEMLVVCEAETLSVMVERGEETIRCKILQIEYKENKTITYLPFSPTITGRDTIIVCQAHTDSINTTIMDSWFFTADCKYGYLILLIWCYQRPKKKHD